MHFLSTILQPYLLLCSFTILLDSIGLVAGKEKATHIILASAPVPMLNPLHGNLNINNKLECA